MIPLPRQQWKKLPQRNKELSPPFRRAFVIHHFILLIGDTNPNRIVKAKKQVLGVSIVVRAGNSEKENEIILDFIEHYYGHMGITPIQRFSIRNTDSLDDLITKQKRNLEEICAFAASLGKNDKGETI